MKLINKIIDKETACALGIKRLRELDNKRIVTGVVDVIKVNFWFIIIVMS